MEQVPLDFSQSRLQNAEAPKTLERMNIEELEALYRKAVEKDPKFRFLGAGEENRKKILIEGILNPEKGLERLGLIDSGDDKAARDANYWDR